jgi:hypothetical protein
MLVALIIFSLWLQYPMFVPCLKLSVNTSDVGPLCNSSKLDCNKRYNTSSYLGTHNSYHVASWSSAFLKGYAYTELPLAEQLTAGVRQIELDIHYIPSSKEWVVFHLPVIDTRTTCGCLTDCLQEIHRWSVKHPSHSPIMVYFEVKYVIDFNKPCRPGASPELFVVLEEAIAAVFGPQYAFTRQDLMGNFLSPQAALISVGWPTLERMAGDNLHLNVAHFLFSFRALLFCS